IWALQVIRAAYRRDREEAALEQLSVTDQLTAALNRRGFFERAIAALGEERAEGRRAAVLALDIDHFKAINDSHGHDAGDAVLQPFAQAVAGGLRLNAVFGRVGGEEFVVLLRNVDLEAAIASAERIRLDVRTRVTHPAGGGVTVSIGVAMLAETADADAALN